jgi:hypothetical protein
MKDAEHVLNTIRLQRHFVKANLIGNIHKIIPRAENSENWTID